MGNIAAEVTGESEKFRKVEGGSLFRGVGSDGRLEVFGSNVGPVL